MSHEPQDVLRSLTSYQEKEERAIRRDRDIDAEACHLLANDYLPALPENIGEFLSEIDDATLRRLALALGHGDYTEAGRIIFEGSLQYWESLAYQTAENNVDRQGVA